MKNKFLSMSFMLLSSFKLFAQNPALILAPKYYTEVLGYADLPVPTVNNDPDLAWDAYDGRPALASSNIIMREDGQILFFYVDGVIYNKEGYATDVMPSYDMVPYSDFGDIVDAVYGGNEVLIVPHPGNCDQFYIFDTDLDPGTPSLPTSPSIILYDAAQEQVIEEILWFSTNTSLNALFYLDSQHSASWWGTEVQKHSTITYSASAKETDGSYYIFAKFNASAFTIRVDQNGLSTPYQFYETLGGNPTNYNRNVSEIYTKNNGEKIVVQHRHNLLNNVLTNFLYIQTFDPLMQNVISSSTIDLHDQFAYIHGLEFSPNGRYIYFTHSATSLNNHHLAYVDLQNPTTYTPLNVGTYNLQFSEIETRKNSNGTLGFAIAHANGLLKLTNPNNPTSIVLSNLFSFVNNPSYAVSVLNIVGVPYDRLKYYTLQDQIDNFDYQNEINTGFDKTFYTATQTTATWLPNNNPITTSTSSTVYIKNELRIPAGKTITIKNMRFEFAPEARVVIENGANGGFNGGKLILDNTTFTVDTRCQMDLWQGVEVLGVSLSDQGNNALTNSKQGILILKNSSVIEYAHEGAESFNGGIIQAYNSTFRNNPIGVIINSYLNDLDDYTDDSKSYFEKAIFTWENLSASLPIDFQLNTHAKLYSSLDVKFIGCKFYNNRLNDITVPNYVGVGIHATNSYFIVDRFCQNVPCQNTIAGRSEFHDLKRGIQVDNFNTEGFTVDRSLFRNCYGGILVNFAQYELIGRSTFEVKEDAIHQTFGIVLRNSTHYVVEGNTLTHFDNNQVPLENALSYGIVVRNSGEDHNEIYRNTFKNLRYGGRVEGKNADIDPSNTNISTKGLQWLCNNFKEKLVIADLSVLNGYMDYQQGYPFSSTTNPPINPLPARNRFSIHYDPQIMTQDHHIALRLSKDVNYYHFADNIQTPTYRTVDLNQSLGGVVYLQQAIQTSGPNAGQPKFDAGNTCPSTFPRNIILDPQDPIGDGNSGIGNINGMIVSETIVSLKDKLIEGDKESLLESIRTVSSIHELMPILIEKSPYLSDRVLEAFLNRNPTTGQMKEILVANSKLSPYIKSKVDALDMPQGTRNQINMFQKGISPREKIALEISYYEDLLASIKMKEFMALYADVETRNEAILSLENASDLPSKKHLIDIYLARKNQDKVNQLKPILVGKGASDAYMELIRIKDVIKNYNSLKDAINANVTLYSEIQSLAQGSEDEDAKNLAQSILDVYNDYIEFDPLLDIEIRRGGSSNSIETQSLKEDNVSNYASMYPNPSSGKIYIDFPKEETGLLEVEIVDITGKIVYTKIFENTNGEIIELDGASKGIYLVKISLDKQLLEVQKLELK